MSDMRAVERRRLSSVVLTRRSVTNCMMVHLLLVWFMLLSPGVLTEAAANSEPLTVSVFISGITEEASGFTGELDGRPFEAAAEIAKDLINSNPDLLPGYELQLDYTDARVSPALSIPCFSRHLPFSHKKINSSVGLLFKNC